MANPSVHSNIVRPFGFTGGRYEVGTVGLRYHRLAWVVAIIAIAAIAAGLVLKWSPSLIVGIGVAAVIGSTLLSTLAVRNGTRL